MSKNLEQKIYSNFHINFFDKILNKKRFEITNIINEFIEDKNLYDALDIGTTNDEKNLSSNIIIKNLKGIKEYKSLSDQFINLKFFSKSLKKSIIHTFNENEIENFSSDLVISNATIEHVGNEINQLKMIENIMRLSKKYFIIITPNRFHPLEFHTKIPLIHWFPKKLHRSILSLIGQKFLASEENLNLLSRSDLVSFMDKLNFKTYEIKKINFLFFISNYILIGKK